MPIMSAIESGFCRSAPWRGFARRTVLPWALNGHDLTGAVLEIGGGSGAMADSVARTRPEASLTVTDLDEAMVRSARARLKEHPHVSVERADVTALPYETGTFETVTSYLMLHHVIEWESALTEAARVLRPGGAFLGYDLTDSRLARLTHRVDGSPYRLIDPAELRGGLSNAGFEGVTVEVSFASHVMRFHAAKAWAV
ncbi:class I SAM-dependent methyltransferase [Cellulomonas hominis]